MRRQYKEDKKSYGREGNTDMSTRGYLTLVDGKKNILSAAYLPSDAYPSYWGARVLDAFQNNSVLQLINQVNQDYPEEQDMLSKTKRTRTSISMIMLMSSTETKAN